jgi:hypothetical protein
MSRLSSIKLIAGDYLKYNPSSRAGAAHLLRVLAALQRPRNANAIAKLLFRLTLVARLLGRDRCPVSVERHIQALVRQWSPDAFDWDSFFPNSKKKLVQKAIILKQPEPRGEKGILFIAFEDNWLRLFRYADIKKLSSQYELVLSPTWSPPYDLPFLIAQRLWPSRLITILSNLDDVPVFRRLTPNVETVPLLASSWVHPEIFALPERVEKRFDVVILANFANYKRHFALFRTVSQIPSKPKVLVLGHAWGGRSRAVLEREARAFGVLEHVTFAEALPDKEMIKALKSARVSVITSLAEGACVAVAESLFADVPVALIEGANVGSRAFINEQTGRFLRPSHISEDLEAFIRESAKYSPRKWMLEHGTSHTDSARMLNEALRQHALAQGQSWTTDIVNMHWRPNAEFDSPIERENMRPEYARFEAEFGIPVQLRPPD